MKCAWDELIRLLPQSMRYEVSRTGHASIQELRMRDGYPVAIVCNDTIRYLDRQVTMEDMQFVINTASMYSPWRAQSTSNGYITASGGHRIGICGEAIIDKGKVAGIDKVSSLCIRVARDFHGISSSFQIDDSSVLILGPPGSGKTTFLRDLIRHYSSRSTGSVAVVDERGEIFPTSNGKSHFTTGINTDILSNCPKIYGIEMVLRTMGPKYIAVDEITNEDDCVALMNAIGCGVTLIATAHANSLSDLTTRAIYKPLLDSGSFHKIIIMHCDKTWHEERI